MRTTRIASVLTGLVAAGMLVLGAGQAVAAESGIGQPVPAAAASEVYGPYEFESACLSAGNQGIDDGRWSDYECNGSYGAWYLYPSHD